MGSEFTIPLESIERRKKRMCAFGVFIVWTTIFVDLGMAVRPTFAVVQDPKSDVLPSEYRRFELKSATATDAERLLRNRLPTGVSYRVFTNPLAPRELVVVGDLTTLNECAQLIEGLEQNSSAIAATPLSRLETSRPLREETWQQVSLKRSDPKKIQNALLALFDARLKSTPVRDGMMFELPLAEDQFVKFGWDRSSPVIYVSGAEPLLGQLSKLINHLDNADGASDAPSVLAYRNASKFSVQSILSAYGVAADSSAGSKNVSAASFASETPVQDPIPNAKSDSKQSDELPVLPQGENQKKQEELLRELRDSVQVETLPDLGIIILRGRQKELNELSRIIQELERLSAETQPEVRLIELRHTKSESIQKILLTTSADLVSGRQGRVTIQSLGKPNALLLVGWGEAIKTIEDLIGKLDQPVAPESQFDVYRLKNAEAATLQTSLTSFFQNREGLGTKIQVITDNRSNSVVVFAAPRDLAEVRRLVQELDVPNFRKKQQARIIKVQNAVAAELATTLQNAIKAARGTGAQQSAILELLAVDSKGEQILRSGILDEVQITPNPVNNTIIVSGPAESMELMEALTGQLDVIGSTSQIKVFRIEHGDAATLVQMLRALLPERTVDRPAIKMASDPLETSLAPLRFSVDTRTNSIIATGSEGDLRIIHALLLRLDEKEFSERRNMVYRLKNAPALDVAAAINNFLKSERQVQQAGALNVSPFEQLDREVVVVPEPVGNRLILSATPRFFAEIEALINQLDEPPPQVMIQVMIAEVTLDNSHEFGIELGLQDSILFDRSLLGGLITTTSTSALSTPAGVVTTTEQIVQAATNSPGYDFNNQPLGNSGSSKSLAKSGSVGTQGLSSFSVGRINNELGFGGLVLSASSESVSALVRALEENNRLEVLSRPQIRTLDNQPAYIQVGQRVPRIIGSTVNQSGQSNSIALENVGLIMGVTPRISPDGTVVMEVDAERSGLGPETEGIPVSVSPDGSIIRSPRIDTTTAQATVSAASGETIILGGLITKKTQTLSRRVPWLSDIPLLGNLFRYDGNFTNRAELLIILTPYVIRNRDDEQRLQQMEFARMNWCLCDIEEIHGSLQGTFNPVNLDTNSPNTEVLYPGQSPVDETAPNLNPTLEPNFQNALPKTLDDGSMDLMSAQSGVEPASFESPQRKSKKRTVRVPEAKRTNATEPGKKFPWWGK